MRISPGRQQFEFQYTGLSFTAPEKVRFKYRLEGLETKWMEAGTKRAVNYSYIRPGKYTFRVLACNNDGVWNDVGGALAFTVLPHFWQTWWFRSLAGLNAAALVAGSVLFATRRRMHHKLERIERQRAIDLGRHQPILGGELIGRHAPSPGGDRQRLHPDAAAAHDRRRNAGGAAPVGDMRERRIVQALSQRPDLLGQRPEDELV